MPESAPQPINALTPEQEARKQRYLTNIESVQNSDLEELYPSEMKKREWIEVKDEAELTEARGELGYLKTLVSPSQYGLFS